MVGYIVGGVLAAAVLLWGVLPLFSKALHIGNVTLMVVGAVGLLSCVYFSEVAATVKNIWQSGLGGQLVLIAVGLLGVSIAVLFVVLSVQMIRANFRKPQPNATVVVLGASLRGDEPSKSLKIRLDAAVRYLADNPLAACVVSGGQGRDEAYTEASIMKKYLIRAGVDENRIFVEEASSSTYENFAFTRKVVEQNGLSPHLAVATQEFHQYRAAQFAEAMGFESVGAVTAKSRWDLLGSYWMRDLFGLCHMLLFGK